VFGVCPRKAAWAPLERPQPLMSVPPPSSRPACDL
jgi:hypothetical protein